MDRRILYIWLSKIKGIGPVITRNLIEFFKRIDFVYEATYDELIKVEGIGDKLAKSLNVPYNYIFGEFLASKEDSLETIDSFDRWDNLLAKEQFELAEFLEEKILNEKGRMDDNSL